MSELYTIKLENNSNANLEGTFDKIDANFQALLSGDYAKGNSGVSVNLQSVQFVDTDDKLTRYGKLFLENVFSDYSISFAVGTAVSDVIVQINTYFATNSIQTYPVDEFLSFLRGISIPVTTLENCLLYDTKELCPIASGMISFVDARNTDIVNSAYKSTYKDLTTYIYFSIEDDPVNSGYYLPVMNKVAGLPTIYWDSDLEQFCWEINGLKGVPAQGPTGKNGVGTEIQLVAGIKNNDRIELKFKWNFSLQSWETIVTATISSTEMALCYILKSDVTVITADTEFSDFVIGFADTDGTTKFISPSYNTIKDILSTLSPLSVFANIGSESSELSNIDYLFLPGIGYAADKNTHPELNCYALTRWQDGTGCYHVTFQPKFQNDTEQSNAHFEMYFQQCSLCDLLNVFRDQLLVTFGCNVNFQNHDAINIGNLSAQTASLTGSLAASTYGRTNALIDADADTALVNKGWVKKAIDAVKTSFSDIYFLKSDYVNAPCIWGVDDDFSYETANNSNAILNCAGYPCRVYPDVFGIYLDGANSIPVFDYMQSTVTRVNQKNYVSYSNVMNTSYVKRISRFAEWEMLSNSCDDFPGPQQIKRPNMLLILFYQWHTNSYTFQDTSGDHRADIRMLYRGEVSNLDIKPRNVYTTISCDQSMQYRCNTVEGFESKTVPQTSIYGDIVLSGDTSVSNMRTYSVIATKDRPLFFDFSIVSFDFRYTDKLFSTNTKKIYSSGIIIPWEEKYATSEIYLDAIPGLRARQYFNIDTSRSPYNIKYRYIMK